MSITTLSPRPIFPPAALQTEQSVQSVQSVHFACSTKPTHCAAPVLVRHSFLLDIFWLKQKMTIFQLNKIKFG